MTEAVKESAGRPVIGWIGAGRLGAPIAERLLAHGYTMFLCEPREEAARPIVAQGAQRVGTPAACARGSDIVFTSLPNDSALQEVALGKDGVLSQRHPGLVFIETSTVSPTLSASLSEKAASCGVAYIRMPVSGNPTFAREGRLTAFVSGPEDVWKKVKPVVAAFTAAQRYLGPGEQARYMKLVVNLLVANMAPMMAEALTLGRAGGIDWVDMIDALADSPLASPWLANKLQALRRRDFSPTFPPHMMLKDIDLMLDAARARGVPVAMTSGTRQMMQALAVGDHADEDFFVAIKLLERQAGLAQLDIETGANG